MFPALINNAISEFKSSNGCGLCNISSFFLKKDIFKLAHGLSPIFSLCLSAGKSNGSWENARVTPIYKYGSLNENSNCRPISDLPVVSPFFEKVVYDQFYTDLSTKSLVFLGHI